MARLGGKHPSIFAFAREAYTENLPDMSGLEALRKLRISR
jgi:hypothetical protein